MPAQARQYLTQFCLEQNFRTDHAMEGFEKVLEWYDPAANQWSPQSSYRADPSRPSDIRFRTRMERPVERAIKLMAPYAGQWTKCSPDVIITFLTHTVHQITKAQVKANGEITFRCDGSPVTFAPPSNFSLSAFQPFSISPLGYYNPDDPAFLHVTDGQGRVLGTWYRRARLGYQDQELLAHAMRYTSAAFKAVQQAAAEISAPDRAELDTMRLRNADLERGNEFIQVADAPAFASAISHLQSPIAAALVTTVARTRSALKAERQQEQEEGRRAAEDLLRALSAPEPQ